MHKLLTGIAAVALLCLSATQVQAQHQYNITAITCGNWNSAGIHDPTTLYEIGYSYTRPNAQIAYFEFNLTPAMGKTYTTAHLTIPGSTDYSINDYWVTPTENNLNDHFQFKVGIRPMCNTGYPETLTEILTGNNNGSLFTNVHDPNRNQDLGYGWVMDGFHFGEGFDMSTFNPSRFQAALNAGGDYILWAADDYDVNQAGNAPPENYIWGSTSYNTGIILTINTSN
jgi:hypothetical protein